MINPEIFNLYLYVSLLIKKIDISLDDHIHNSISILDELWTLTYES